MRKKELKIQIYDSVEESRPNRGFPVTDEDSIFEIFSSGIKDAWDMLANLRTVELIVATEFKNGIIIKKDVEEVGKMKLGKFIDYVFSLRAERKKAEAN